ncbi:Gfo/Idh/MocA family oxidoreductase [Paenibacillus filicis]|uniref:Gfo/Idh/MocA family oxidoreductase n=1 Tax=Paenibacillus gyeongsangnamensis TaxID=3388067 RepID=A0ABT4QGR5_9BACL|nr:Gfo/Idh/MocA family oxidoreductase [Paenibacillus filicis]MCZ8516068.1 Gfo/Idh/MocA family oxidoreductase [Paenibacillus filicis]
MKTINVGIIGSGFSAALHVEACRKVIGLNVCIRAIAGGNRDRAESFAGKNGIPIVYNDYKEMLADKEIDVVDLCIPNMMHAEVAVEAARAQKHIICEKPMTGYFGSPESITAGNSFAKTALEQALRSADEILHAVRDNNVKFMYAENWIYAPSVAKAKRLLHAGNGSILDIRAEESHSGSHAKASKRWETAGGGSLMILGSHPIAAAIHLKNFEGRLKWGKPIRVQSVVADMAPMTKSSAYESVQKHWMVTDWVDVETWASVILTFTDGTKAVIFASFAVLGGIRNVMDIYTSNSVIKCNMTPNDGVMVYAPSPDVFAEEYIAEKLETKAGWNFASSDEDWVRGYNQEMQDFMECIAEDRLPLSDGQLARDVLEVIYSAYLSYETGQRIEIKNNEEEHKR